MEAIVLAGGLGTRLRAVVPDLPKPMAVVAGRPFLEIVLAMLAKKGFLHIVCSIGYLADTIVSHFGSRFMGMTVEYVVETSPLGTGGALRRALPRCRADHALVLNGDTFLDLEIDELESAWHREHQPVIVGKQLADTSRYGRLALTEGTVVGFVEKGIQGPGVVNAGHYLFPVNIAANFPKVPRFSLENDFLVHAVCSATFRAFISRGRFIDIGVPEDYAKAQLELAEAYC